MAITSDDAKGIGNRPFGLQRRFGHRGVRETYPAAAAPAAPVISNVTVTNIGTTTATITWDTDLAATSRVDYGLTASYGSAEEDLALVTSHSVTLTGLTDNTTYHYQVSSTANAQTDTEPDATFATTVAGGGSSFLSFNSDEFRVDFEEELDDQFTCDGTGFPVGVRAGGATLVSTTPAWSTDSHGNKVHGAQFDDHGMTTGLCDIPLRTGKGSYSFALNKNASLPVSVPADTTIVCSQARTFTSDAPTGTEARPLINRCVFFSVLGSSPAPRTGNDQYIGPVPEQYGSFPKSVDVWDGDVSIFPSIADPSVTSDMPTAQSWLDRVKYRSLQGGEEWTFFEVWLSADSGSWSSTQGWFGRDTASLFNEGCLMLCYSRYSDADKRKIAARLAYLGKQIYYAYKQGARTQQPNGAHGTLDPWPIAFYGCLIGDTTVQNYIKNNVNTKLFGAALQFGWIPDSGSLPTVSQGTAYTENTRGMPEFGKTWGNTGGGGGLVAYKWVTAVPVTPYRTQVGTSVVPFALFAHFMAGVSGWDIYDIFNFGDQWPGTNGGGWDPALKESPIWDYIDRHVIVGRDGLTESAPYSEIAVNGIFHKNWIKAAYDEHRHTENVANAIPKWSGSHADQEEYL